MFNEWDQQPHGGRFPEAVAALGVWDLPPAPNWEGPQQGAQLTLLVAWREHGVRTRIGVGPGSGVIDSGCRSLELPSRMAPNSLNW